MGLSPSPRPGASSVMVRGLRLGLLALALGPSVGCSNRPAGPVAVPPGTSPATPEQRKEMEKNPLILRD